MMCLSEGISSSLLSVEPLLFLASSELKRLTGSGGSKRGPILDERRSLSLCWFLPLPSQLRGGHSSVSRMAPGLGVCVAAQAAVIAAAALGARGAGMGRPL